MLHMQRRTALTGIGSAIGGLAAGGMFIGSTDTAKASVSMGQLNMSGASKTTDDGNISNVKASVAGEWAYEIPGGDVDYWIITLDVSDGETWATVAETQESQSYHQYTGSYSISGSVTDTSLFDASFFSAPSPGQQKSVQLPFRVTYELLDTNDTPLATTSVEDTATVAVGQSEINASLYGELSGEGGVSIET